MALQLDINLAVAFFRGSEVRKSIDGPPVCCKRHHEKWNKEFSFATSGPSEAIFTNNVSERRRGQINYTWIINRTLGSVCCWHPLLRMREVWRWVSGARRAKTGGTASTSAALGLIEYSARISGESKLIGAQIKIKNISFLITKHTCHFGPRGLSKLESERKKCVNKQV